MKIQEFRGKNYFLSNFYIAPVEYKGIHYTNNEAAFQAQKVLDRGIQEKFSHLDPSSAKSKGRHVRLRSDWEKVKDQIMYEVCQAKFTQNEELKERLIQTGEAELVEGNTWGDSYWGVCRGTGKNKLGKILMRIREEIQESKV